MRLKLTEKNDQQQKEISIGRHKVRPRLSVFADLFFHSIFLSSSTAGHDGGIRVVKLLNQCCFGLSVYSGPIDANRVNIPLRAPKIVSLIYPS